MTFEVRTRSQASTRISSESRSPTPKRSRNEEEPKLEEENMIVENDSPKIINSLENTVDIPTDNTVRDIPLNNMVEDVVTITSEIPTSPEKVTVENSIEEPEANNNNSSECDPNLMPENDENDDADTNISFNFPSLVDPNDKKIDVQNSEEKRQTPEVIQLDDETSTASSPMSTGQQLPKLITLETDKESDFANRRRPPFRRPTSRRRKRQPKDVLVASDATVTQQQQLQSPLFNNGSIFPSSAQTNNNNNNNLFRKPLTPIWNMIRNFPKEISNEYAPFHAAMCQWKWEIIDEIQIPVILRDSQMLVAHSVAHIKLFSKFPTNVNSISQYLPSDVTLESLPMTESEAWMMNFINTIVGNYELGMQIFQNGDTLVELQAIELYYFFAKKHYLEDLLRIYDGAVPQEALTECKNIIGAILNLKKKILDDLKVSYSILGKVQTKLQKSRSKKLKNQIFRK
uniref:BTB domain-containing protein n=1 Tax=Panagrolaimus sp. ES5 TaxID=591445 RepID=A0AC34GR20_9BILA